MRNVAHCRAESDSCPLSVGRRKSCEAGLQPLAPKSVNAWRTTAAQKHYQTHSKWPTASFALKWQVRMCSKQPIAGQKATPSRSTSVEGRVVSITEPRSTANGEGLVNHHWPEAQAGHLDRCGSSRTAKTVL